MPSFRFRLDETTIQKLKLPTVSPAVMVHGKAGLVELRFVQHLPPLDQEPPALTAAENDILAVDFAPEASRRVREDSAALSAAAFQQLVDSALTVDEAAGRLRVNHSRIRQRLAERSLSGIKVGTTWRLPEFQFLKNGMVPGMHVVLKALPADISPVAVARWFEIPNPDLCSRDDDEPLTPLQWLVSGYRPQTVAELAAAL